jgi:hypothetical protein
MPARHRAIRKQQQAMSRTFSTHDVNKLGKPKYPPEYPDSEDQDLQDSGKVKVKSHRRRHRHHDQQVKTHEDAVADQVVKGHSLLIAKRIVQHLYGNTLPHAAIHKGDDLVKIFERQVERIMKRDGCSRTEAMRKARCESSYNFTAYQIL